MSESKCETEWQRACCPTCGSMAEVRNVYSDTPQWRPPSFTSPNDGPFIVRQEISMPGDRTRYVAIDPSTGITPGSNEFEEQAASDRTALNAAYWLGVSHESHRTGAVVAAATVLWEHQDSELALCELFVSVRKYHGVTA